MKINKNTEALIGLIVVWILVIGGVIIPTKCVLGYDPVKAELPMKIDTTWRYEPFVPLMDIYFVWDFCSKELARKSLENHCFEFALYLDTSDIYYTTDTTYRLTEEQVAWLGKMPDTTIQWETIDSVMIRLKKTNPPDRE